MSAAPAVMLAFGKSKKEEESPEEKKGEGEDVEVEEEIASSILEAIASKDAAALAASLSDFVKKC